MIKKIEAAIRPDKLNVVMQALIDTGAIGVTAIEVKVAVAKAGWSCNGARALTSSTCCRAC